MRKLILQLMATSLMSIPTVAVAQSLESCTSLKAQLEKSSSRKPNAKKLKRYSSAIKQQTKGLAKLDADLRRYKCKSGKNEAKCEQLSDVKTRMQTNLQKLADKREKLTANPGKLTNLQIESRFEAFNCNGKTKIINVSTEPKRDAKVNTGKSIGNGVKILGESGGRRPPQQVVTLPNSSRNIGNYRTLCVRSCDGFFFPISSNTSSNSFERDELACQLMCPGTKTDLYFHRSRDQESEDMISYRGGESYEKLPNAFSYRTNAAPRSEACSCNMSAFHAEMSRRETLLNKRKNGEAVSDVEQNTLTIIPIDRQDPGEDPETISNLLGNLTDDDIAAITSVNNAGKPIDQSSRAVRIVGPTFLQDKPTEPLSTTQ